MRESATTYVKTHRDGVIATVTLSRPERRNAMGLELCHQLEVSLRDVLSSDDIRILILAADGPAFCAGADLKEELDDVGRLRRGQHLANSIMLLWEAPVPVVARVQGSVRGGAAGLIAACDVAVAAGEVTFAFPEVRIGVVPAIIAPPILARCQWSRTAEYFLTGEVFTASAAADMGLISRVVAPKELDRAVSEYREMLLAGSPSSLATTRRLVRRHAATELDAALEEMLHVSATAFASDDAFAARRASGEGRLPPWVSAPDESHG